MSVSVSIPTTVQIRRSRLIGLIALVAVLAAAVTSIGLTIASHGGASATASSLQRMTGGNPYDFGQEALYPGGVYNRTPSPIYDWGSLFAGNGPGSPPPQSSNRSVSAVEDHQVSSTVTVTRVQGAALASMVPPDEIMSLTPAQLDAGASASVLASMSPATRRYTKAVMNLTFAQLAAGAAGSP